MSPLLVRARLIAPDQLIILLIPVEQLHPFEGQSAKKRNSEQGPLFSLADTHSGADSLPSVSLLKETASRMGYSIKVANYHHSLSLIRGP
jgi:hypothetical protein